MKKGTSARQLLGIDPNDVTWSEAIIGPWFVVKSCIVRPPVAINYGAETSRSSYRTRLTFGLVMAYGVVLQVMPAFAGITVFRWDINIRESTVLGLVGAGGIGLQLNASIMNLAWTQASLILIVIIATVIMSEWVSAKVRHLT